MEVDVSANQVVDDVLDIHPLLLGNPATVFFGFDSYPELHSCQNTALAAASPFLGGAT